MKQLFYRLFKEPTDNTLMQFFRYIFVGGASFVIDSLVLFILSEIGIHYLISTAIAFIVGLAANYFLSKLLVFQSKTNKISAGIEFLVYAVIGVIGLALTELLMYLFTEKIGLYYLLSKIIAAAIVLVWNFGARKISLYRNRKGV